MASTEDVSHGRTNSARCNNSDRCAPYNKQPTQWDVSEAHSVPDAAFLSQFKTALSQSQDALGCEDLIAHSKWPPRFDSQEEIMMSRSSVATVPELWPMAAAVASPYNEPDSTESMPLWRPLFQATFGRHLYVSSFQLDQYLRDDGMLPPYFDFALACLASRVSPQAHPRAGSMASPAAKYFDVGLKLYIVTLELDNREARTVESVISSAFLATFGLLSADESSWLKASVILTYSTTILRRLQMLNCEPTSERTQLSARRQNMIVGYRYLVDVLLAIHIVMTQTLERLIAQNH
ncbi:hypothetical protein LMH87_000178 [Akanthomyces muscarius]|uniref:Transcription factor domain-containing protein n=1 Tax=Akanthomyces muscarius TaxID=2231603 RepID=A0A9W8QGA2_AKAMU|nr:hypothetical protein LMH87_000178 [Akanthomyces muscarius]KAJ4154907.1 hypothetical protein LMH87_000178 [Akanthomyces muscarius]